MDPNKTTVFVSLGDAGQQFEVIRKLCGLSPERFGRMFDFVIIEPLAPGGKRALKRSPTWYDDHQHDCIVIVGKHTGSWLGIDVQANSGRTVVKGKMRLVVVVDDPIHNPKSYSHPSTKARVKALLDDVVLMNTLPVTTEDARKILAVVQADPDILSYWTKKCITEIEAKLEAGTVDRWDLSQLMETWANDVKIGEGL